MPIPGAKYRYAKRGKKKIRLAFANGKVVEAKNMANKKTHTPAEFAADRKKVKRYA